MICLVDGIETVMPPSVSFQEAASYIVEYADKAKRVIIEPVGGEVYIAVDSKPFFKRERSRYAYMH